MPAPPGSMRCTPPSIHAAAVALNGPTLPSESAHRPQYTTRIGTLGIGGVTRIGERVYDRKYHAHDPYATSGLAGNSSSGGASATNNSSRTAPGGRDLLS